MLMTYVHCHRGKKNCTSMDCVAVPPEGTTEEQIYDCDFEPVSFMCCGLLDSDENPDLPQDCYRLCFKNEVMDTMHDNDLQDLTHQVKVISTALAVTATRMVNGGTVEVPTRQKVE